MKIKEKNEQWVIIAPGPSELKKEIIPLVVALGFILFPVVIMFSIGNVDSELFWFLMLFLSLFVLVGLSVLLWSLGRFIGSKMTIDKISQTITFTKRPFLLVHRRREIPFSVVKSVDVVHEEKWVGGDRGGGHVVEYWVANIDTGNEMIFLDMDKDLLRIRKLAQEVADFLRKPVSGWAKDETREEATETFVEGLMRERERRQRR